MKTINLFGYPIELNHQPSWEEVEEVFIDILDDYPESQTTLDIGHWADAWREDGTISLHTSLSQMREHIEGRGLTWLDILQEWVSSEDKGDL